MQPCMGKYKTCPNLVPKGNKYCTECLPAETEKEKQKSREYETQRGNSGERGYNSRWQKVRMRKMMKQPLCEMCLKQNKTTPAYLVHHIDENPKNNNMVNLMSLCNKCHEKIHNRFHKGG